MFFFVNAVSLKIDKSISSKIMYMAKQRLQLTPSRVITAFDQSKTISVKNKKSSTHPLKRKIISQNNYYFG